MIITDPAMARKFERALKLGQNLYSLADIDAALKDGRMQAHTVGETLVITKVNDWPQRRSVEITYVVGNLAEALEAESQIEEWSKSIGAELLTAVGRDGWWAHRIPGWKKIGTLYAKEI